MDFKKLLKCTCTKIRKLLQDITLHMSTLYEHLTRELDLCLYVSSHLSFYDFYTCFSLAEFIICEQNEMVEDDDKDDAEEKKEDIQASQEERRRKITSVVLKSMALLVLVGKLNYQTHLKLYW